MGIKDEFEKFGADLANIRWAVSAHTTRPRQVVITVWEHLFPQRGQSRPYTDDVSKWKGNVNGRNLTLKHLAIAHEENLPVRMVRVAWVDQSKKRKTFVADKDWVGRVEALDGDSFTVIFTKDATSAGAISKRKKVSAAEAEESAEALIPPIDSTEDARQWALTTIALRRGQAAFRAKLLEAYDNRCAITGCDVTEALEAAHILPFRGKHTHVIDNGLLLRADLHTLFDLGLIWVNEEGNVGISGSLKKTAYAELRNRPLNPPAKRSQAPKPEYLAEHAKAAQKKRGQ